jgi:CRISPR/Cas system CSM-associated protein Csm3 (group 7 of RAMP superfamily)
MEQIKYTMNILLLSDTLIGATEGYGAVIDKDSVFDEVGLPIIPGKRVKGILREQADLLKQFGVLNSVEKLFGETGLTDKNTEYLSVSSFTLLDYEANKTYLKYLIQEGQVSRSEVIEHFTTIRMMTSIDDDGIASDTSLRTFRVLKKGLIFSGEIHFKPADIEIFESIISLTRRIGSIRNRGLGQIKCSMLLPVVPVVEPEKTIRK